MNTDTHIFGYTDGMSVHPQEDDIVLCPSDGAKYFEANPNEWRIMRAYDRPEFIYHKCDDCQKMIFPVMVKDTTNKRNKPITIMSDGQTYEPHRLKVFVEFLETLED
jgi:hypothetical protein